MSIKIGVVGLGMSGWCRCETLIENFQGKYQLIAVCDVNKEMLQKATKEFKVKGYQTFDEFLQDPEIELVFITAPTDTHEQFSVKAMKAGKAVLVEKPMALSAKEADHMIEVSRQENTLLTVYQNRRWDGDYSIVKELVVSGSLGKIFDVQIRGLGFGKPDTGWRSRKPGGGILYDWGSHFIDQLLHLVSSPPKTVLADVGIKMWHEQVEVEDHFTLAVKFEDGTMGIVEVSSCARVGLPKYLVLGDKGGAKGGGLGIDEIKLNIDGKETTMEPRIKTDDRKYFYDNLYRAITEGAELAVKPEEARQVMAVIDAARKSSETGEGVRV